MSTSPDARMGAAMSKLNWLAAPCVTCPLIILRRSNATGHASSASSQWISRSCRRVACGLVLHFGVKFGPDQDHDRRQPNPGHEADDRAQGPVGPIEAPKIRSVP